MRRYCHADLRVRGRDYERPSVALPAIGGEDLGGSGCRAFSLAIRGGLGARFGVEREQIVEPGVEQGEDVVLASVHVGAGG